MAMAMAVAKYGGGPSCYLPQAAHTSVQSQFQGSVSANPYGRGPYGPMDGPAGLGPRLGSYPPAPAHTVHPPVAMVQLNPELLQAQMAGWVF